MITTATTTATTTANATTIAFTTANALATALATAIAIIIAGLYCPPPSLLLPLLSPSLPTPLPVFASPVIGWLLHCFLLSAFVIAHCHATVDALVAFCRQSLSIPATAAAAAAKEPPLPPLPPLWSNSPSSIAKERVNSSTTTSIPMAAPT
jgi:hypothetical protein